MIHTMRGLNGEVAMIEDIGKIADLPELALSTAAIFLRETPMIILKRLFAVKALYYKIRKSLILSCGFLDKGNRVTP
jgi:hypothetical protein